MWKQNKWKQMETRRREKKLSIINQINQSKTMKMAMAVWLNSL